MIKTSFVQVSLCLQLGDQRVKHIDLSEEGLEQFLHVRNRLFTGISFEIFEFDVSFLLKKNGQNNQL